MRFSIVVVVALHSLASAAAVSRAEIASIARYVSGTIVDGKLLSGLDPDDITIERNLTPLTTRDSEIHKREILLAIAVLAGSAVITELSTLAADAAVDEIKKIGADWTTAREKFTQSTTATMWSKNPNPVAYPGVACYNMGYKLKNGAVEGKINAKLTSGLLNTDYDCMYVGAGNAFYTQGDGGYINAAFRYSSACSFDGSIGDLSC